MPRPPFVLVPLLRGVRKESDGTGQLSERRGLVNRLSGLKIMADPNQPGVTRLSVPTSGQKSKIGQNGPEKVNKEQPKTASRWHPLADLNSSGTCSAGFCPRIYGSRLKKWVGWDSNPQPTPKAFGAALPLGYRSIRPGQ
jgi:hypothetical protein